MPTISKALQSQIFKRGLKRHLLTKIQRIETNWTKAFIFLIIWFLFMNQTWIKKSIPTVIHTGNCTQWEMTFHSAMAGESSVPNDILPFTNRLQAHQNMRFSIDFMISAIIDWRPILRLPPLWSIYHYGLPLRHLREPTLCCIHALRDGNVLETRMFCEHGMTNIINRKCFLI